MKIKIDIEKVACEIEADLQKDGDGTMTSVASINGEIHLTENGFSMNLLSEEDRNMLANRLRDAIMTFVVNKMGYSFIEDEG